MQMGGSMVSSCDENQSGEIMQEKYKSYMRGLMRATAEAKGRDAKIAEAFVDPEVSVPQLKPDGKLLTLTASEGVKSGIVQAVVNDVGEIYKQVEKGDLEVVQHHITVVDRIIAFLINP